MFRSWEWLAGRRTRTLLAVLVGLLLLLWATAPLFRGFHVGFNSYTDNVCETRLGIQWCGHTGPSPEAAPPESEGR